MDGVKGNVVLIGMMGAGKTAVGKRLATRLGRPFLDTDQLVEAGAGHSVAEIFSRDGEAAFRALERAAVAEACSSPIPVVIACGGGAVLDPENREQLTTTGLVVWLRAPVDVLAQRVGRSEQRPLLEGGRDGTGVVDRLAALAAARESAYAAAARAVVDTEGRNIDTVVEVVLEELDRCVA
jgi:shikimate kinase